MDAMRMNKSMVDQEIDTGDEWGRGGMIHEDLLKIRRSQARDEIDQSERGPPRFGRVEGRHHTARQGILREYVFLELKANNKIS